MVVVGLRVSGGQDTARLGQSRPYYHINTGLSQASNEQ